MLKNISSINSELQKLYARIDAEDSDLELVRHLISMACLELEKAEKTKRVMQEYGFNSIP